MQKMNVLVASCKRVMGKFAHRMCDNGPITNNTIQLSDGATVIAGSLSLLDNRAKELENSIRRPQVNQYRTNIAQRHSLAVKTQSRDYVLETMLQSGEYTFDHMYVIRNPYGESPLTALALFVTDISCKVRVTVKGKTPETDFVSVLPSTTKHRVPIFGLYPNQKNTVLLELLDDGGNILASHEIPVETKGLPGYMKDCVVVKKKAEDPAFPFVLINGGVDIHTCAFDQEGDIRFYLRRKPKGYGIFPFTKGRFFYLEKYVARPTYANPQAVQSHDMDYMGRVFKTYHTKIGVHHTAEEKTGGNILVGSNTMMEHSEDRVIEIDRNTGEIVWSLAIGDLFDDTYKDMIDWCHTNSAAFYEKDRSVLISLRNVHAVICVDYDTKKLRWMLSDPEFWAGTPMTEHLLKPIGDVPWFYQQHAAYEIEEDFDGDPGTKHVMVYDNHWIRRRPADSFDDDPLSYVSFYDVNEQEMTVKLNRRFASPKTKIRANGIYVPEKKRVYNMAGCYAYPEEGIQGGVFEYDFETGEVVSEYGVKPGYFRGYKFEPDMEQLTRPMEITRDYFAGELERPVKLEDDECRELHSEKADSVSSPDVEYCLQEDILMIHAVDHQLQKIYLLGEKGGYVVDYSETYQTMDIFRNTKYYYTAQLDELPSDKYEVYLDMEGDLQKTGKYIEKRHLLA